MLPRLPFLLVLKLLLILSLIDIESADSNSIAVCIVGIKGILSCVSHLGISRLVVLILRSWILLSLCDDKAHLV